MIHEWADQCVCLPELEPDDPPALYPRRMVERSDTHRPRTLALMGIAKRNPSYESSQRSNGRRTHL